MRFFSTMRITSSTSLSIILFTTLLLTVATVLAENDANDGQSCPSSAIECDEGNQNCCTASSQRQTRRNQDIKTLPLHYRQQLAHIDSLIQEEEEDEDPVITCDAYLKMEDYVDPVAIKKTLYQEISWAESTEKPDICLTLDDTLQICNSYRPHYHEYFVHFPASFLPQLKRAIFIGGGDSMLLHELLHYPDLQLIVGLELDQAVVRESLNHFFTRPHFDNPKVQWWFGDAAKSLSLLPAEFFGSFDLVMVDLSETVMSMSVSEEINILKALALLLNDHGIFVKNEKYITELSEIFKYVIQIYLPDTPLLCDQDWVLGSNGIDFLHPDFERLLGKYKVPTYHYEPLINIEDHYELIKDYAKNDIRRVEICEDTSSDSNIASIASGEEEERNKFGLMMAIEGEHAVYVSDHDFDLTKALVEVVEKSENLRLISSESYQQDNEGQLAIIFFNEGYITARTWPSLNYCAFDLVLWGRFHQMESIRDSLLSAVGVDSHGWSSFRIVVGGMYGTDSWKDDKVRSGPTLAMKATCDRSKEERKKMDAERVSTYFEIVIKESLSILPKVSDGIALVFCGSQRSHQCESLTALRVASNLKTIFAAWSCHEEIISTDTDEPYTFNLDGGISHVDLCKESIHNVLEQIYSNFTGVDLLVVDAEVPSVSVIEISNALSEHQVLNSHSLIIIPHFDTIANYLLEICRLNLDSDVRIAELSVGVERIGYLSVGNPLFLANLVQVMERIEARSNVTVDLVSMKSSQVSKQENFAPHNYTMVDFDESPGIMQYSTQQPLGKQSLLQMSFEGVDMTNEALKNSLMNFLQSFNKIVSEVSISHVGKGSIIHSVFNGGSAIVVWNGKSMVDMNVFSFDETMNHKVSFETHFVEPFNAALTLWDEQPRGVSKVINFSKDIRAVPGCVDRFVLCLLYEDDGDCDDGEEKDWMDFNCKLACNLCGASEKMDNIESES